MQSRFRFFPGVQYVKPIRNVELRYGCNIAKSCLRPLHNSPDSLLQFSFESVNLISQYLNKIKMFNTTIVFKEEVYSHLVYTYDVFHSSKSNKVYTDNILNDPGTNNTLKGNMYDSLPSSISVSRKTDCINAGDHLHADDCVICMFTPSDDA